MSDKFAPTPVPWKAEPLDTRAAPYVSIRIIGERSPGRWRQLGYVESTSPGLVVANADLLLRAVNSHARLLAALDRLCLAAERREYTLGDLPHLLDCKAELASAARAARCVLRQITEEPVNAAQAYAP